MTLDDVLQRIKAMYTARVNTVKKNSEAVRTSIAVYEKAAEEDCLTEFLVTNGLSPATTTRKADDAALQLLAVVENLPELSSGATTYVLPDDPEPEPQQEQPEVEEAPEPPLNYPALKADGRVIVLFGGFVNTEKMSKLTARTGLKFEWVSNERNGSGDMECASLITQLRSGRYVAVVLMNELMSHAQSDQLVQAAKRYGVKHALGRKAGTGTLLAALDLFEKQLTEQAK